MHARIVYFNFCILGIHLMSGKKPRAIMSYIHTRFMHCDDDNTPRTNLIVYIIHALRNEQRRFLNRIYTLVLCT